jgi:hypothetical protein
MILTILILALIAYFVVYYFDITGRVKWIIYACVIGIPLILIPFVTGKAPPDLAKPLLSLPYMTEIFGDDGAGTGLLPRRVLIRRTWGM